MINQSKYKDFGGFAGRFALVYLIFYMAAGVVFLNLQGILPAESRVALDFFEPYRLGVDNLLAQFLLGVFLALVLYPFYNLLVRGERGLLILFAALWGVALLGNLEPKPGSIEGMIYTHTTFFEHFLVMATGAVQYFCFALVFLHWEKRQGQRDTITASSLKDIASYHNTAPSKWLRGYTFRFTLVHVIIYWVVGSVFYEISGYEEALATMEAFALWRDLESLTMVGAVFFGQIFRGAFLALLLYAFYGTYMSRRNGWLLLLGLVIGLKVFPAIFTVPESLGTAITEAAVGLPEIVVQTLVFSLAFYAWEKRRSRKIESLAA